MSGFNIFTQMLHVLPIIQKYKDKFKPRVPKQTNLLISVKLKLHFNFIISGTE